MLNPDVHWIEWWLKLAQDEITLMEPKVSDYGSQDLLWIGHQMAASVGRKVDDEEATELGIYFYLLGKVARWSEAVREGRRPIDDTIHDIGVYCRMAQRNRAVGGWPYPYENR